MAGSESAEDEGLEERGGSAVQSPPSRFSVIVPEHAASWVLLPQKKWNRSAPVQIGYHFAAKSKKDPRPEDAPTQVPMAPRDSTRTSPSTDQLKARRRLAMRTTAGAYDELPEGSTAICQYCHEPILLDQQEGGGTSKDWGSATFGKTPQEDWQGNGGLGLDYGCSDNPDSDDEGTGGHEPEPGTISGPDGATMASKTNQIEAQLLAAMAKAPYEEQRKIAEQLNTLRAERTAKINEDRSMDLYTEATFTTPLTDRYASTDSDWLLEEPNVDLSMVQRQMAAHASKWYGQVDPFVKRDATEYQIQAKGMASYYASQYAPHHEAAADTFVRQALFLNRGPKTAKGTGESDEDYQERMEKDHEDDDGKLPWEKDDDKKQSSLGKPLFFSPFLAGGRTAMDPNDERDSDEEQANAAQNDLSDPDPLDKDVVKDDKKTAADDDNAPKDKFAPTDEPDDRWAKEMRDLNSQARRVVADSQWPDPKAGADATCKNCGEKISTPDRASEWFHANGQHSGKDGHSPEPAPGSVKVQSSRRVLADDEKPFPWNQEAPSTENEGEVETDVHNDNVDDFDWDAFDNFAPPVAPENASAVQEEGDKTPMPGLGESVSSRTAADGNTCSVCGDSITRDPEGEENRTWHHTDGTSHDHEAKPSSGDKESARTAADDDEKKDNNQVEWVVEAPNEVASNPTLWQEWTLPDEGDVETGQDAASPGTPTPGSKPADYPQPKKSQRHVAVDLDPFEQWMVRSNVEHIDEYAQEYGGPEGVVQHLRDGGYSRVADGVAEALGLGSKSSALIADRQSLAAFRARVASRRPFVTADYKEHDFRCQTCGATVTTWGGEDTECPRCGQPYNAFGQRLRDDYAGNPSNYDEDIDDMTGYEMQHAHDGSRHQAAAYNASNWDTGELALWINNDQELYNLRKRMSNASELNDIVGGFARSGALPEALNVNWNKIDWDEVFDLTDPGDDD